MSTLEESTFLGHLPRIQVLFHVIILSFDKKGLIPAYKHFTEGHYIPVG